MSALRATANYITAISAATEPDVSSTSNQRHVRAAQPEVCSYCYGTGMEVIAGKGARR